MKSNSITFECIFNESNHSLTIMIRLITTYNNNQKTFQMMNQHDDEILKLINFPISKILKSFWINEKKIIRFHPSLYVIYRIEIFSICHAKSLHLNLRSDGPQQVWLVGWLIDFDWSIDHFHWDYFKLIFINMII